MDVGNKLEAALQDSTEGDMTNPSCVGNREIICGAGGLQSLVWVLGRTQEVARHPTGPHKTRLDPFCMLSFSLVMNANTRIGTGSAWRRDVNLIKMLSIEFGHFRLFLVLVLVPCSSMPSRPEANNSLVAFSVILF